MKSKNMPLVSVIIPTKNSELTITKCLRSIKKQSYQKFELIVVDNNSSDRTKLIANKFTKKVFNEGPERSAQRNFGAKKAKGEYLLFIDSDMELSKYVINDCVNLAISLNKSKLSGIIIPELSVGNSFWAKCKALERSFYLGVDWIEAPRFFPKKIFNEFDGYDEGQTGTEDFDLPQRIKNKLGKNSITRIKNPIYHNEGNLSLTNTLKKKFYYVKTANAYLSKKQNRNYFKKQSSLSQRYGLFFSDPIKLFKNPLLGLGMLFMKSAEFGAGGLGTVFKK